MTIGKAIDHVLSRMDSLGLWGEPECYCYSVSEAVYHLSGKRLKVFRIPPYGLHPAHFFLKGEHGEIIDLTAGQFGKLPDYNRAIHTGFYPRMSNMAKRLIGP